MTFLPVTFFVFGLGYLMHACKLDGKQTSSRLRTGLLEIIPARPDAPLENDLFRSGDTRGSVERRLPPNFFLSAHRVPHRPESNKDTVSEQ